MLACLLSLYYSSHYSYSGQRHLLLSIPITITTNKDCYLLVIIIINFLETTAKLCCADQTPSWYSKASKKALRTFPQRRQQQVTASMNSARFSLNAISPKISRCWDSAATSSCTIPLRQATVTSPRSTENCSRFPESFHSKSSRSSRSTSCDDLAAPTQIRFHIYFTIRWFSPTIQHKIQLSLRAMKFLLSQRMIIINSSSLLILADVSLLLLLLVKTKMIWEFMKNKG